MTGSKNHERGARGSTEEDPYAFKRANMAVTEDVQDQEPTTSRSSNLSYRNHRHRNKPLGAQRKVC